MFGFGNKNQTKTPGKIINFLEEADRNYICAFETRSIGVLKKQFTRDCCLMISRWITAEAVNRFFGNEKYRKTTWDLIDEIENGFVYKKTCIYKEVKLTMSRNMKISDDYSEEWTVLKIEDSYMVSNVQAV